MWINTVNSPGWQYAVPSSSTGRWVRDGEPVEARVRTRSCERRQPVMGPGRATLPWGRAQIAAMTGVQSALNV